MEANKKKIPVDHFLTHQPASSSCDVCRQAKLRTHPHRRFPHQAEGKKLAQVVEAPRAFLQRIACDHLEAVEGGSKGEKCALVCVDVYSGSFFAYPAIDKSQESVEAALRHFSRVTTGRSFRSVSKHPGGNYRDLGMHPEPSPPGDKFHNPDAESAIKGIRQGTRSFLLQSGLDVKRWPKVLTCFCFQYSATTPPNIQDESLRGRVRQAQQEDEEDSLELEWESKLHMALTYPVEGRMFPFGSLVWYKKPETSSSFLPTIPALYVGPEVLPAMRFKDTHVLYDLKA